MLNHATQLSWWKQVLISLLAIAFEIGCASCRNHVWPHFGCNFRAAKLLSGSMAAVAALLAGLIPVDGLVNLLGMDVIDTPTTRGRGIIGVATATAGARPQARKRDFTSGCGTVNPV